MSSHDIEWIIITISLLKLIQELYYRTSIQYHITMTYKKVFVAILNQCLYVYRGLSYERNIYYKYAVPTVKQVSH